MDPKQSQRFTISYSLFDGLSKKWTLDGTAVLKSLGLVAIDYATNESTVTYFMTIE